MNRQGETYEEHPPPGEYRVCPLVNCRYKLRVGDVDVTAVPSPVSLDHWPPGATIAQAIEEYARKTLARQEWLFRAHLNGHTLMDFYETRSAIMADAHERVAKIMKLADLMFTVTATQEPEGGQ